MENDNKIKVLENGNVVVDCVIDTYRRPIDTRHNPANDTFPINANPENLTTGEDN